MASNTNQGSSKPKRTASSKARGAKSENVRAARDDDSPADDQAEDAFPDPEDERDDASTAPDDDEDEDEGEDEDEPPRRRSARRARGRRRPGGQGETFAGMMRAMRQLNSGGGPSSAEAMFGMMGAIPAFAVGESMISQSHAQGLMMQNSVLNQQRNNMLAMVTTAGCVAQMLDMKPGNLMEEFDDDLDDAE